MEHVYLGSQTSCSNTGPLPSKSYMLRGIQCPPLKIAKCRIFFSRGTGISATSSAHDYGPMIPWASATSSSTSRCLCPRGPTPSRAPASRASTSARPRHRGPVGEQVGVGRARPAGSGALVRVGVGKCAQLGKPLVRVPVRVLQLYGSASLRRRRKCGTRSYTVQLRAPLALPEDDMGGHSLLAVADRSGSEGRAHRPRHLGRGTGRRGAAR